MSWRHCRPVTRPWSLTVIHPTRGGHSAVPQCPAYKRFPTMLLNDCLNKVLAQRSCLEKSDISTEAVLHESECLACLLEFEIMNQQKWPKIRLTILPHATRHPHLCSLSCTVSINAASRPASPSHPPSSLPAALTSPGGYLCKQFIIYLQADG